MRAKKVVKVSDKGEVKVRATDEVREEVKVRAGEMVNVRAR